MGKTLEKLRRLYYWPNMTLQVRGLIRQCTVCKETKSCNQITRPALGNEVITVRPFQKLYMDFLGKYPRSKGGNCFIFIVVDHFSKFTFLKAMPEATARRVTDFLRNEIFHKFGVPETVHTDNGVQFSAKEFENLM